MMARLKVTFPVKFKGIIRWSEIFCLQIDTRVLGKTSKFFDAILFLTQVMPI